MKNKLKIINLFIIALAFSTISCGDDDNQVSLVNLQDLELTIDENPADGEVLGTITSDGVGVGFSITSQTPSGALSVDAGTGEVSVADASLFDFETHSTITATISAENAENSASVTISVINVSEVTTQSLEVTIDENPINGQVLGTLQTAGSGALNFSITSQSPDGAMNVDASTGEVTVADASLFDFEVNPTLTATVEVDDSEPATITINLTNVYELTIQDFSVDIDENPTNGQVLGTLQTDGSGVLNFSITSQSPDGAMNVDASTGEITVADASLFDFEVNQTLTATVGADDSDPATITINLNNVNELSVEDYESTIDENASDNQSLGFVPVIGDGDLSFFIISQTPANAMDIDQFDGELTVRTPEIFDYETNPVITASISVNNESSGETVDQTLTVTINLNNVNEIGDFAYGGVIFWVDPADNNHGLVCSTTEQGNAPWGCSGTDVAAANGTAITTGKTNTEAMAAACSEAGSLAITALNLTLNGFSDWFVPSKDEMYEIYLNREAINAVLTASGGEIFSNSYWTSTQFNVNNGWFQSFSNGSQAGTGKTGAIKYRVIREFDLGF
ncbi:hypothetical protein [Ekhidna sp.]|uniref:hypothetical protein n=1 Tax=Ekhidna sp. TaxID=2608089 RepID=UPI003C7AC3E8